MTPRTCTKCQVTKDKDDVNRLYGMIEYLESPFKRNLYVVGLKATKIEGAA